MNSIPLPYHPDSCRLFEALRGRPGAALLDSGHPGSPWGRFDLLVAEPAEQLIYSDGICQLHGEQGVQPLRGNPLERLRQRLAAYPVSDTPEGIPFCGGALGYFSYDLGRAFEQLPQRAINDLSLPQLQVGIYRWAVVVDHKLGRTQLVSPLLTATELAAIAASLEQHRPPAAPPFALTQPFSSNLDPAGYRDRFERIQAYIQAGDCYQVNLAQRFSAAYQGDPWQAYRHLRQHAPTPFSAYLESPQGSILSLSPERFIATRGCRVETRPIKGTRPRASDPVTDQTLKDALRNSPKDRAENLMIVDLLRNDLGRSCVTGSVQVPELFKVESYANVHHLVSTITGRLANPQESLSLLGHSFPGGSITGAPKIRAMQIIEELEPHRRGPYCGSIGYIGFDGRMDTSICIRTLVANQGRLHCWAGGGIVADSDCAAEYQETFDKVSNLLRPLEQAFLTPRNRQP